MIQDSKRWIILLSFDIMRCAVEVLLSSQHVSLPVCSFVLLCGPLNCRSDNICLEIMLSVFGQWFLNYWLLFEAREHGTRVLSGCMQQASDRTGGFSWAFSSAPNSTHKNFISALARDWLVRIFHNFYDRNSTTLRMSDPWANTIRSGTRAHSELVHIAQWSQLKIGWALFLGDRAISSSQVSPLGMRSCP